MEDILKFTILNKLKSVYRMNSVENRKESSAEHTWSTLMLADLLFDKSEQKLDKLKVYDLLMYHDVVEIEAGDTPLQMNENIDLKNKFESEKQAMLKLKQQLPEKMAQKFYELFIEFEELKTPESKFAKIIDTLDAEIHELDYKKDWKGWTKEFLIEKKMKYFEEFPKLKEVFLEFLNYAEKEGYFSQ
ncbi:MAG: HD family hydrolase [Candidatus Woesearchaeota archaeon]